jgi:hypothetical protein
LPLVGSVLLLGLLLWKTDRQQVAAALAQAQFGLFAAVVTATSILVWLYDTACLWWLLRATLPGPPIGYRDLLAIKASSYVLNIVNYHAAALGMAALVGRRKQVPFLQAAGALAALSWLDLVTVSGMAVLGLWLAPEVLGGDLAAQRSLQWIGAAVFGVALLLVLVLQTHCRWPPLQRLRAWAPVRPLAALRPWSMLQGLVLRGGLIAAYTVAAVWVLRSFGLAPRWAPMFVIMPILTVVGTIPVSVSGLGTTQVLMERFYAPFVVDGRAPTPVIDACSTAMIFGYIAVRLVIAAPFVRRVLAELNSGSEVEQGVAP